MDKEFPQSLLGKSREPITVSSADDFDIEALEANIDYDLIPHQRAAIVESVDAEEDIIQGGKIIPFNREIVSKDGQFTITPIKKSGGRIVYRYNKDGEQVEDSMLPTNIVRQYELADALKEDSPIERFTRSKDLTFKAGGEYVIENSQGDEMVIEIDDVVRDKNDQKDILHGVDIDGKWSNIRLSKVYGQARAFLRSGEKVAEEVVSVEEEDDDREANEQILEVSDDVKNVGENQVENESGLHDFVGKWAEEKGGRVAFQIKDVIDADGEQKLSLQFPGNEDRMESLADLQEKYTIYDEEPSDGATWDIKTGRRIGAIYGKDKDGEKAVVGYNDIRNEKNHNLRKYHDKSHQLINDAATKQNAMHEKTTSESSSDASLENKNSTTNAEQGENADSAEFQFPRHEAEIDKLEAQLDLVEGERAKLQEALTSTDDPVFRRNAESQLQALQADFTNLSNEIGKIVSEYADLPSGIDDSLGDAAHDHVLQSAKYQELQQEYDAADNDEKKAMLQEEMAQLRVQMESTSDDVDALAARNYDQHNSRVQEKKEVSVGSSTAIENGAEKEDDAAVRESGADNAAVLENLQESLLDARQVFVNKVIEGEKAAKLKEFLRVKNEVGIESDALSEESDILNTQYKSALDAYLSQKIAQEYGDLSDAEKRLKRNELLVNEYLDLDVLKIGMREESESKWSQRWGALKEKRIFGIAAGTAVGVGSGMLAKMATTYMTGFVGGAVVGGVVAGRMEYGRKRKEQISVQRENLRETAEGVIAQISDKLDSDLSVLREISAGLLTQRQLDVALAKNSAWKSAAIASVTTLVFGSVFDTFSGDASEGSGGDLEFTGEQGSVSDVGEVAADEMNAESDEALQADASGEIPDVSASAEESQEVSRTNELVNKVPSDYHVEGDSSALTDSHDAGDVGLANTGDPYITHGIDHVDMMDASLEDASWKGEDVTMLSENVAALTVEKGTTIFGNVEQFFIDNKDQLTDGRMGWDPEKYGDTEAGVEKWASERASGLVNELQEQYSNVDFTSTEIGEKFTVDLANLSDIRLNIADPSHFEALTAVPTDLPIADDFGTAMSPAEEIETGSATESDRVEQNSPQKDVLETSTSAPAPEVIQQQGPALESANASEVSLQGIEHLPPHEVVKELNREFLDMSSSERQHLQSVMGEQMKEIFGSSAKCREFEATSLQFLGNVDSAYQGISVNEVCDIYAEKAGEVIDPAVIEKIQQTSRNMKDFVLRMNLFAHHSGIALESFNKSVDLSGRH